MLKEALLKVIKTQTDTWLNNHLHFAYLKTCHLGPLITIHINTLSKKFYNRWIFKDIDFRLPQGTHLALVGANGSGKSTLLRIIAGQTLPTRGNVQYLDPHQQPISIDNWYKYISWASPAQTLYTDLTLQEHIHLHFRFKKSLLPSTQHIIDQLNLSAHQHKKLMYFSSGMLQRVKIGIAVLTASPILLLDEPTSFMDETNTQTTLDLIQTYTQDRTYILASNVKAEYTGFDNSIHLS